MNCSPGEFSAVHLSCCSPDDVLCSSPAHSSFFVLVYRSSAVQLITIQLFNRSAVHLSGGHSEVTNGHLLSFCAVQWQCCSAVQLFSCSAVQLFSCSAVQLFNCSAVQVVSSSAGQLFSQLGLQTCSRSAFICPAVLMISSAVGLFSRSPVTPFSS